MNEQSQGEPDTWPEFILHNTPGLRVSKRERKPTQFFQASQFKNLANKFQLTKAKPRS